MLDEIWLYVWNKEVYYRGHPHIMSPPFWQFLTPPSPPCHHVSSILKPPVKKIYAERGGGGPLKDDVSTKGGFRNDDT